MGNNKEKTTKENSIGLLRYVNKSEWLCALTRI